MLDREQIDGWEGGPPPSLSEEEDLSNRLSIFIESNRLTYHEKNSILRTKEIIMQCGVTNQSDKG